MSLTIAIGILYSGSALASGSISGRVTSSTTSSGLPGTRIDVYDLNGHSNGPSASTTTDSFGQYVLFLPDSAYAVVTQDVHGYINQIYPSIPCSATCDVNALVPVVVAGSAVTGINFVLDPGGRIAGIVTDRATGLGIAGVTVTFADSGGQVAFTTATTDGQGHFLSDAGTSTGTVYAGTTNAAGYINQVYNNIPCNNCDFAAVGTPFAVTAGVTTSGLNFALDVGGRIAGRVTGPGAVPLANIEVDVVDLSNNFVDAVTTDASGNYTSDGLPNGSYHVATFNRTGYIDKVYNNILCLGFCNFSSGAAVAVTAPNTTPNINFTLSRGGTITGTVKAAVGGAAIPNANVTFYNTAGFFVTGVPTNSTGVYTVLLPPGSYFARTFAVPGFVDQLYNGISCATGCTVTGGTALPVTADTTLSNVNFTLSSGGAISGTVTNAANGQPLANVQVQALTTTGLFVTSTTTTSTGAYTIFGLVPGTYYVRTSNASGFIDRLYNGVPCPLGSCLVSTGTPVIVTGTATTGNINFALSQGGRISGRITNAANGSGIANLQAQVYTAGGAFVGTVNTDASGNYTTSGLPPATYFVRSNNSVGWIDQLYQGRPCMLGSCLVTTGTPVGVTTGATTSGVDLALTLGGRISGRVTNAATGAGLLNVQAKIYDAVGTFLGAGFTDASGNYTTGGLPGGTYYARTGNAAGFLDQLYNGIPCPPNGTCPVTTGAPIAVVPPGTTANINFALTTGATITGTVTNAAGGAALAGIGVWAFDTNDQFVTGTATDAFGGYSLSTLLAGTYFVRTANSLGFVDQLYHLLPCVGFCQATAGTPVIVGANATVAGINFSLTQGGRISGTVVNSAGGAKLANVAVQVFDAAGHFQTSTSTDASGNYTTTALPSGNHYLRTFLSGSFVDQVYPNVDCPIFCDVTVGTAVVASPGTTVTGINFSLSVGGKISGRVTAAVGGVALANVNAGITKANGTFLGTVATDASGNYTTPALPAGTYYVNTSNVLGFVDQLYSGFACPFSVCVITTGTPVSVTPPTTTPNINFALAIGATITGTVTNAAGATPLVNAPVLISDAGGNFQWTVFTNGIGGYSITGLTAGTYHARVSAFQNFVEQAYNTVSCPGGFCSGATDITVAAGSTASAINFALTNGGRISGTVTAAVGGAPLANVRMQVFSTGNGAFVGSVQTDASGNYTTFSLAPGNYYVGTFNPPPGFANRLYNNVPCSASCAGVVGNAVAVTAGSTTININFSLPPAATPPTLTQPTNRVDAEDSVIALQLVSTNPNGGTLTYSATNLPNGVTLNTSTGLISGRLSFTSAGSNNVTVGVNDGTSSDSKSFTWTVTDVNRPPTLDAVANRTDSAGRVVLLQLSGNDPDGTTLSYGAANLPPGIVVDSATGSISGKATRAGVFTVTATASDGSLSASQQFTWVVNSAANPRYDYDGDGKSDLVVFTPQSGTWTIATSSSNFASTVTHSLGAVGDIAVPGDYDGDGKADVATYRPSTGVWTVLTSSTGYLSNITATLGASTDVPVPGDYDGDGKTDFAVFTGATGTWSILLSSTGFLTTSTLTLGASGDIPVPGDYDGDGITDAAVFHPLSGVWSIQRSSGGTLSVSWGDRHDVPLTGDFDGDGKSDIVVYRSTPGVWYVLRSSSGFVAGSSFTAGGPTAQPVPADYDDDGTTDIAVMVPTDGSWTLLKSSAGFAASNAMLGASGDVPVPMLTRIAQLAGGGARNDARRATDIDGDGRADLLVYRPTTGGWSWLKSSNNYASGSALPWGVSGDQPVPGDYDGDGKTDIAVYHRLTGDWKILTSSSNYANSMTHSWGSPTDIPVPGDYDGDGKTDIAVYRPLTGTWFILRSSTNFTAGLSIAWGTNTDVPMPGDYDGDGVTDIAFFRPSTGEWSVRLSSTGYTTTLTKSWGAPTDVPVPGDYDGDGVTDFAVYRPSTGQWFILRSQTNFTAGWLYQLGQSGDVPIAADFDGDGRAEIAVYHAATGAWSMLTSASTYATTVTFTLGSTQDALTSTSNAATSAVVNAPKDDALRGGDYDGDRKRDIAAFAPSSGTWSILDSTSGYATGRTRSWGDTTDVTVPGDYDGDGKTDIAIFRPSSGTWFVLKSSSNFTAGAAFPHGTNGDVPVPGDYDGDGITDLAVYRPSTGQWLILMSSTGLVTTIAWGMPGDIPVPADYDGDHRTDLATFTPSTGVWSILTSTTSYLSSFVRSWGDSADKPVPGDYDGDGIADIAVYRPSNGNWFILRSNSGFVAGTLVTLGSPGDIPVPGDYDGDGSTDVATFRPSTGGWHVTKSTDGTTIDVTLGDATQIALPRHP